MDFDARNILDQAGLGVLITDRHYRMQRANQALLGWLGRSEAELLGRTVESLVDSTEVAVLNAHLASLWNGDAEATQVGLLDAQGKAVRVCMHPVGVRDPEGSPLGSLVLLSRVEDSSGKHCCLHGVNGHAQPRNENRGSAATTGASTREARASLTRRQLEIFDMLALGRPTTMIAESLGISPHTVRNHVKAIYTKLGIHSRTEFLRAHGR